MACVRIKTGFVCSVDRIVDMSPFGARVWMEWHNYLGPTFYRSAKRIRPIYTPSRKTWDAFYKWQAREE